MPASKPKVDAARVPRLRLPVAVRVAHRKMPLSEVLALTVGSLIEFDKPSNSVLDLTVNGRQIGVGSAVVVGEKFGLRVDEIGPARETVRKLGPLP